ncbi:MAG: MFS transporter, partial [bacterium]
IWELGDAHPVVDLSLFKGRNFSAGVIAISVGYGLFFGSLVILPLWLQTQIGYTATEAGKVMAPVGILAILMSPIIGKLLPKTDSRMVASFAFIIFAVVFYLRSRYTPEVDTMALMIPTLIQGAAMSMFFIPLSSIILSGQPHDKMAAASGLSNFVRIMFGGIGASVSTTLWSNRTALHHAQLAEHSGLQNSAFQQTVQGMTSHGMSDAQAHSVIDRLIGVQASTMAATDIFWISAIIFLLLIGIVWLAKPIKSHGTVDTAGAH